MNLLASDLPIRHGTYQCGKEVEVTLTKLKNDNARISAIGTYGVSIGSVGNWNEVVIREKYSADLNVVGAGGMGFPSAHLYADEQFGRSFGPTSGKQLIIYQASYYDLELTLPRVQLVVREGYRGAYTVSSELNWADSYWASKPTKLNCKLVKREFPQICNGGSNHETLANNFISQYLIGKNLIKRLNLSGARSDDDRPCPTVVIQLMDAKDEAVVKKNIAQTIYNDSDYSDLHVEYEVTGPIQF